MSIVVREPLAGPQTVERLARALGISTRRLRLLCAQGRVLGAFKDPIGGTWDVSHAHGIQPASKGPRMRFRRLSRPLRSVKGGD
jgi:hypothetical protein